MRKKALGGRQLALLILFMGFCNIMTARCQSGQGLASNARTHASAMGRGSGISAPDDQAKTISILLSEARRIFDVDFIYESRILPEATRVIEFEKFRTVEEFLDELLKPYKLRYKKVLARAYVIYSGHAGLKKLLTVINRQKGEMPGESINPIRPLVAPTVDPHIPAPVTARIIMTGRVFDEGKGTPVEGVSVLMKGSNRGTVTAADGSFRLETESRHGTLIFSLIGYQTQEVVMGSRMDIQLTMTSQSLNDVVVIGYGTQRKTVVTGAIASLRAADLENMPVSRIEQSLQGRASGITIAQSSGAPGAPSVVKIRGTTSINNSDPLYVVDGVPVDGGGIDYLNQSDIESVEVLKDGASAAIYGTRAASGVILVTTKKGKAGGLRVSYNGYYGSQAPVRKLKLLDATQYATLRNESSVAAGNGVIFPDPQALGHGTDWQSLIFNKDARIQDHVLSLSGGNDRSVFYTSFSFFDQNGIVLTPVSNYKRFTARFNSTHKIRSWLTAGNNLSYSYIRNQSIGNANTPYGGPLSSAINLDPVTPAVVADPAVADLPPYNNEPVLRDGNGRPFGISSGPSTVGQEMSNPMAFMQTILGNFGWSDNLVGNVFVEMEPVKGLKFRSGVGAKLVFFGSENFTPIYFLSPVVNNLTNASFYKANNRGLIWNWDNTVSYTRSFGLHNLSGLVGTSMQANSESDVNTTYYGIPATNFRDASSDYNVAAASRVGGGKDGQPYRINSWLGRVTYDYDGKYLLTGILRIDGSSRFARSNRYGRFPSVSAGWIPSKESFWPVGGAVSFLKFRASYGINGNDQSLGDFQFVSMVGGGYNYTFGNNVLTTGYAPTGLANPGLKWEQTAHSDIGMDAVIYKNFYLTADVYNKRTTGMLLQVNIPGYVGASANPYGNIADLEDRGIEMDLGYAGKIGAFNLDIHGNASYNKNTITNIGLNNSLPTATFQSSAYEVGRTAVGHPLGAFFGFQTLGIFQTAGDVDKYLNKSGGKIQPNAQPGDFKFADLDGNGVITGNDRTFLGDPSPHWTFGFTINASWRNFDIIAFGQGVSGNKIYQGLRRLDIPTANYSVAALGRWTGPGTSNDYPRLTDNDINGNFSNPSSFYLSGGAYFKVKTIQLGYSLPKVWLSRVGVQKVRIYFSVNNLLTITRYPGFDPEVGGTFTNQNNGSYGVDNGIYPQARSLMAGLNVAF